MGALREPRQTEVCRTSRAVFSFFQGVTVMTSMAPLVIPGFYCFYYKRFNLTILPTAIHSSTYRFPCLSQQMPCGETKTPSSHCSRGSLLVARFLAST